MTPFSLSIGEKSSSAQSPDKDERSATPRTDVEEYTAIANTNSALMANDKQYVVPADFARELERELDFVSFRLAKRLEEAEGALAGLADCINTELRENYGHNEQIQSALTDMRPVVRLLVDKVRERYSALSTRGALPK